MLTAKILVKLKTMADHAPYLNTLRAITGKESREDMAEDLATRHYNKHITDYYVSGVVDSGFTKDVVDGRSGGRTALAGAVLRAAGAGADPAFGGGLTHAGYQAPAAGLAAALGALGIRLPAL
jgi:hypothetical protein